VSTQHRKPLLAFAALAVLAAVIIGIQFRSAAAGFELFVRGPIPAHDEMRDASLRPTAATGSVPGPQKRFDAGSGGGSSTAEGGPSRTESTSAAVVVPAAEPAVVPSWSTSRPEPGE